MYKLALNIIAFSSLCFSATIANAQPVITSVGGSVTDGGSVTISGFGFGNGPNIVVFDDFEGGVTNQAIDLNATVGRWTESVSGREPLYDSRAHSGSHSMRAVDSRENGRYPNTPIRQFKLNFSDATELFLSYWIKVPAGYNFPGSNTAGQLPTSGNCSTFKMTWVFDGDTETANDDVVMPTQICGGFVVGGNAGGPNVWIKKSWWRFDTWQRITVWLKANESDPLANGFFEWQVVRDGSGIISEDLRTDRPVFRSMNPPYRWNWINIAGWAGNGESGWWTNSLVVMDDIYFAAGANARARVEIGDAPTYRSSKTLALTTPTSWVDGKIVTTIRRGSLANYKNAYLYVIDAQGNINANGYSLCPDCPKSPTNNIAK